MADPFWCRLLPKGTWTYWTWYWTDHNTSMSTSIRGTTMAGMPSSILCKVSGHRFIPATHIRTLGFDWLLRPGKNFSGRYFFALRLFFFLFFNVCRRSIFRTAWRISTKFSHNAVGLTGSTQIENGRHLLSRLAAILEKLCFHTIMTVQVLLAVQVLYFGSSISQMSSIAFSCLIIIWCLLWVV